MIGLFIPQNTFIERRKSFNYEIKTVWLALNDIEGYSGWKPRVKTIETLGLNVENLPRWREVYENGFSKDFSLIKLSKYTHFSFEENYAQNMNVTWIIKLTNFQSKTVMHLKKYSRIQQPFKRFETRYLEDGVKEVDRFLLSLNERLKTLER